jgi:hypothetical protein
MAPKSLTLQDMRLFQALNKVMAELFEYRVVLNGIVSVKVQTAPLFSRAAGSVRPSGKRRAAGFHKVAAEKRRTWAPAPIFRGLALNSHALRTSMRRIVEGIMCPTRIDGAGIGSHTYSESPPPGRSAIGS